MKVKRALSIILLFLLLFSTISAISADDDRSYSIDKSFIDLNVGSDGLLHVDEQYDYTFHGSYNGVYRDIPLKSGESIDNLKVSAIGAYPVLKESDENGVKHLKIYLYDDEDLTKKIKDCEVSVLISYDMENVITLFNDVGALQYKLWGDRWEVDVGSITATVTMPGNKNNIYYLNPEEYTVKSKLNGDVLTAETTYLPNGEQYELLLLMPLNDFDNAFYAKHVNENGKEKIIENLNNSINQRNFWNTAYIVLGLLSILGPAGAIFTYLKYGREPSVNYDGIYERDLPSNDSPEVINALIENKKEIGTPNLKGFEASIMNLIDRKILRITNKNDNSTELNDLILTFNDENSYEISSSEKIIVSTLKHFSKNNSLNLSKLNSQLSSETEAIWFMDQFENWKDSVNREIDQRKYFDNKGSKLIKRINIAGIVFAVLLIFLGLTTNLENGIYSTIAGIFLLIFSIIVMKLDEDIFGRWTEYGRTFYLKWKNLKKFLKDNSLIDEHPPESIVIWKKYLIYGTALGVADNVYKSMKLKIPNITEYDDDLFRYHHYGGYGIMYSAFKTGETAANPSSGSSDFGSFGGGSGGGGGGAF